MNFYVPGMKFNVRFTFSRFPLKLQHRAVDMAKKLVLSDVLFPTPSTCGQRPSIDNGANMR